MAAAICSDHLGGEHFGVMCQEGMAVASGLGAGMVGGGPL